MARVLVAVGPEHGEGVSCPSCYALVDLSVLQLAYVLDDVVDELVARGVWEGERPRLRLEPIASRAIGGSRGLAALVDADADAKQWPGIRP